MLFGNKISILVNLTSSVRRNIIVREIKDRSKFETRERVSKRLNEMGREDPTEEQGNATPAKKK